MRYVMIYIGLNGSVLSSIYIPPCSGSVMIEHLPGMQEFAGSILSHVKQEMLKFEILLFSLMLST